MRIAPHVISQEVLLGETVLMDVETLVYYGLDPLGTTIWQVLQRCSDADEAFERVRESEKLDPQTLKKIFSGVLRGLEASRIIELEPHAG